MNSGPSPMNSAIAILYSSSIEPATTAGPPVPRPTKSCACTFSLLKLGSSITWMASMLDIATCIQPKASSICFSGGSSLPVTTAVITPLTSLVRKSWMVVPNMAMLVATLTISAARAIFVTSTIMESRLWPVTMR